MKRNFLFVMGMFLSVPVYAQLPATVAKTTGEVILQGTTGAAIESAIMKEATQAAVANALGVEALGASIPMQSAASSAIGTATLPSAPVTTGTPLQGLSAYNSENAEMLQYFKKEVTASPAGKVPAQAGAAGTSRPKSGLEQQLSQELAQIQVNNSAMYLENRRLFSKALPMLERPVDLHYVSEDILKDIYGSVDYTTYNNLLTRVDQMGKDVVALLKENKTGLAVKQRDKILFYDLHEGLVFHWSRWVRSLKVIDPATMQAYQKLQRLVRTLANQKPITMEYDIRSYRSLTNAKGEEKGVAEFFLGDPVDETGRRLVVNKLPLPKNLSIAITETDPEIKEMLLALKTLPEAAGWTLKTIDMKALMRENAASPLRIDYDVIIGPYGGIKLGDNHGMYRVEDLRKSGYSGLILTTTRDNPYFSATEGVRTKKAVEAYAKYVQTRGIDGSLRMGNYAEDEAGVFPRTPSIAKKDPQELLRALRVAYYFKGGGKAAPYDESLFK